MLIAKHDHTMTNLNRTHGILIQTILRHAASDVPHHTVVVLLTLTLLLPAERPDVCVFAAVRTQHQAVCYGLFAYLEHVSSYRVLPLLYTAVCSVALVMKVLNRVHIK